MVDRIIDWLASKATSYLVWVHERDRRVNREINGPCPDCDEGPLFCSCDEELCYGGHGDSYQGWYA